MHHHHLHHHHHHSCSHHHHHHNKWCYHSPRSIRCKLLVVILKHSPCTVIGWELHPADAASAPGAERFLNYMPRCIYLKFAGATWTVDKRLGPGVWPLFPVHRTWELNAAQGSKIKRHGFTLLPDYASTAFMIQGATLRAAIAACGDVADAG